MQFYCSDYRDIVELVNKDNHSKEAYAVRRACAEFVRLIMHRNSVRQEMVKGGVFVWLSMIVADHVEEGPEVLADCCRFLQRTISLKEPLELDIQSRITEARFLPLIQQGLERHASSENLFVQACRLLALMCFDMPNAPHTDNQADIASAGLLRCICDRLTVDSLSEQAVVVGTDALLSLLYEHVENVDEALDRNVLTTLHSICHGFGTNELIIEQVARSLFYIVAAKPSAREDIVQQGLVEQMVDFLDRTHKASVLCQWHLIKFLEMCVRECDVAGDEFVHCKGPAAITRCVLHAQARYATQTCALFTVSCVLFCSIALTGDPPVVTKSRLDHLMQSGVHQFAVVALRTCGNNMSTAAQAIRLLDTIATIDTNRIPLTRVGASRQVRVVYNSCEDQGVQALCERAIAAIEGT